MLDKQRKNFFENYMKIIGPLGNLFFYFQAYNIFSLKNSGSVSLSAFIISLVGLTSWLLYGVYLKNKPLILSNCIGLIGAVLVIAGVVVYPS